MRREDWTAAGPFACNTARADLEAEKGHEMTTPDERTLTVVMTREFLRQLADPTWTKRIPQTVRARARTLLRHYPEPMALDLASQMVPSIFGPGPDRS